MDRAKRLLEEMDKRDSNGDGCVSSAELAAAFNNPLMSRNLAVLNLPYGFSGQDRLLLADEDFDGKVMIDEFATIMRRIIDAKDSQSFC